LEAMLRIALEGPDETLPLIIEETIPLWKNETKYQFLILHVICLLQVTFFLQ
jgi:hypothetical protein